MSGRAVHQVYGLGSFCQFAVLKSAGQVEDQPVDRLPCRLDFRALDVGVEIEVDRGAIDDLGYLVVLIVVQENIAVQRNRIVQQRVLRSELEGVDDVEVKITFTPRWDPRTMASDDVKMMLGIY